MRHTGPLAFVLPMLALVAMFMLAWYMISPLVVNVTRIEKIEVADLRHPTFQELLSFLASDHTDKIKYRENEFDCKDFANTLRANAMAAGWDLDFVILEFKDTLYGHAINGALLADNRYAFIEPQTDEVRFGLQEGGLYYARGYGNFVIQRIVVVD